MLYHQRANYFNFGIRFRREFNDPQWYKRNFYSYSNLVTMMTFRNLERVSCFPPPTNRRLDDRFRHFSGHFGLPWWLSCKEPSCQYREGKRCSFDPSQGREDPLEKEMATHSSILAWKTPRTENPGGLQSMESERVGHDWAYTHARILYLGIILQYLWNPDLTHATLTGATERRPPDPGPVV